MATIKDTQIFCNKFGVGVDRSFHECFENHCRQTTEDGGGAARWGGGGWGGGRGPVEKRGA